MNEILHIRDGSLLLAIVVTSRFQEPGIHFVTANELSQQLAYMNYPAGKVIPPHVHNPAAREVVFTQETLFIKKGKLRVDFFTAEQEYLESRILVAGDVILLIQGGHGFEVLEPLEMIEVKQGPYAGDKDKTRFIPSLPAQLNIVSQS
jgi:mannose-6-phosphate isomerase-like protein (cupin superfamily)